MKTRDDTPPKPIRLKWIKHSFGRWLADTPIGRYIVFRDGCWLSEPPMCLGQGKAGTVALAKVACRQHMAQTAGRCFQ